MRPTSSSVQSGRRSACTPAAITTAPSLQACGPGPGPVGERREGFRQRAPLLRQRVCPLGALDDSRLAQFRQPGVEHGWRRLTAAVLPRAKAQPSPHSSQRIRSVIRRPELIEQRHHRPCPTGSAAGSNRARSSSRRPFACFTACVFSGPPPRFLPLRRISMQNPLPHRSPAAFRVLHNLTLSPRMRIAKLLRGCARLIPRGESSELIDRRTGRSSYAPACRMGSWMAERESAWPPSFRIVHGRPREST